MGWTRKAARRAVRSLVSEGLLLSMNHDTSEYAHRGLRWVVKGDRVVTAFPPNEKDLLP